eukprot:TRINITY_DN775919_c0_g1_i1.p1 TRINITY_DN775919_c0_g1~~TRINITY_DN775919_c0_g1_i1.p1  ORF type:complete len:384 (-),score=93.76 TRINITY_DN775919_c0_g1_i1:334-1485(-)
MNLFGLFLGLLLLTSVLGLVTQFDDFRDCTKAGIGNHWNTIDKQWGGETINGGVNPELVECVYDNSLGKQVLQFSAHGDKFTGTGPIGKHRDGTLRGKNEEFTHWNWGYKSNCSPHCDVARVGAAVQSKVKFNHGILDVKMKVCENYGALSSLWFFDYAEETCSDYSKGCTPEYTKQCCNVPKLPECKYPNYCMCWKKPYMCHGSLKPCSCDSNDEYTYGPEQIQEDGLVKGCTKENDLCQGEWIKNSEIDIETPTASRPDTNDPKWISFRNMRYASYRALPSSASARCGVHHPCANTHFRALNNPELDLNDGKYHSFRLVWGKNHTKLYVDGHFYDSIDGTQIVPDSAHLWMGVWLPNAWAGTPDFDTCQMRIDYVRFQETP